MTMKLRLLAAFTLLSHAAAVIESNPADDVGQNTHEAVSEQRALRAMGDRLDALQHEIQELRALSQHHHNHHETQDEVGESRAPDFNTRQKQIQGATLDRHKSAEPAATYFTLASEMTIFFTWFKTDTWESYSFALVMALFLAALLEFMNGRCQKSARRSHHIGSSWGGTSVLLCNTFARFIAAALQFSLILIVTTYDGGLFLAACGGMSAGYFFSNWLAQKGSEDDNLLQNINKEQPDIGRPEVEKPSLDEDSSTKDTADIEHGETQSSNGLGALTINRLETISEDGQSKASCASSTEDGGSIYSFKSSGTKSRSIPSTIDQFEDEPKRSIKIEERRRRSAGSSSNQSSFKLNTTSDDVSVGSSASRKKVTVVIRDTNDLRAKLAALQTVSKDTTKQQRDGDDYGVGDDYSVGYRSVSDDRSIGNGSLRSVPVSLNTPGGRSGAGRTSRGFGRGRRARNAPPLEEI